MTSGEKTREEIREYIIRYIQKHGYSPTFQEIGAAVGLKSKSSVSAHIQKMLETGMIETDAEFGVPRAIRIPGYHFVEEKKR
ncbi:MAG: LexA family protein [Eisenbergiella massiliensis]